MNIGCYMLTVNHWVLLLKPRLHCMLTNLRIKNFFKKERKANEQREKIGGGKPRNGLLTLEHKLMVTRGEVGKATDETGDGD